MREKSICTNCTEELGYPTNHFFYQVNVEQLLTGMNYYNSTSLPKEDYLSSLLLFSMKTDYPRCLLSASSNCPGQFCRWYVVDGVYDI